MLKWLRWLNKLYAFTFGYFWLPCRLCGRIYGGHEKHGRLMTDWSNGHTVCIDCAAEAEKRNHELLESLPRPMAYFDTIR